MRIGIMLRHFEQHEGGVKVYTRNLVSRILIRQAANEYYLIYNNPDFIGSYAGHPNVNEISLAMPTRLLWDQIGVPWIARRYKLDLIFNPKFTVPIFTRKKTVFVRHGSERYVIPKQSRWFECWFSNLLIRRCCRSADAVICVSELVRKDLIAYTGISAGKTFTIHNGYDDRNFRVIRDTARLLEVKRKFGLPERFILWVGQVDPRKNIARLLTAFDKVRNIIPHNLVLAGLKGWKAEDELRPIQKLGLIKRVNFIDWVSHNDLPVIYNLADLFVFPSLYEGFGLPLIEAMACGCPVLTADRGSPPEVTEDAALLVNPLDVEQLAQGMHRLLTDQILRQNLRAKGLKRVETFTWDRCAAQVLALFDKVYAAGHTPGQATSPCTATKAHLQNSIIGNAAPSSREESPMV